MSRGLFSFVTLRYVHDAVTQESVNVGLVAYWPTERELKVRVRSSMGRVRQLFPDADRAAFLTSLRTIRRALASQAKLLTSQSLLSGGLDALGVACASVASDDSAFQWSGVGRGYADDPTVEFEALYDRLVARYDATARSNRSDEAIWKPVRDQLAARAIEIDFEEKSLSGDTDTVTFDNAWKNGRWHAYQAVSLDLSTPENILDKARRWRGQMVGVAEGARVRDEPIELSFLLGRPHDEALIGAYEHAVAIFRRLPLSPKVYQEEEASVLVDEIEKEYREHGTQTAG